MSDIVERLRLDAEPTESDMEEAATEIERLRARVAVMKDLVEYLAGRNNDQIRVSLSGNPVECGRLIERARAALEA
jgi:hypothetical protein